MSVKDRRITSIVRQVSFFHHTEDVDVSKTDLPLPALPDILLTFQASFADVNCYMNNLAPLVKQKSSYLAIIFERSYAAPVFPSYLPKRGADVSDIPRNFSIRYYSTNTIVNQILDSDVKSQKSSKYILETVGAHSFPYEVFFDENIPNVDKRI